MAAAATARQAAAAALARALATALREFLADAGDGDACGGVRLLLSELAAALHAEPQRQEDEGAAAGPGLPRTHRRRAQRRAALARLVASGAAHGGNVVAVCERGSEGKRPALAKMYLKLRLAAGERHATGDALFDPKDAGAGRDESARAGVARGDTESAGARLRRREQGQGQGLEQGQAAAPAAAPATTAEQAMAQTGQEAQEAQPAVAEPRVAVAAAPHKRRAVAAGTAVGATVGVGGKLAAGGEDEGKWTTVLSRRARRQERARLEGTSSGAARKAAAARAAATRRTAAAVIEYYGIE